MNKYQFFLAAMRAEAFLRTAWVISAFAVVSEGPDDWQKEPYPYRIVQTPTAYFFVDPENQNQLTKIDDATVGQPLFSFQEKTQWKPQDIPNLNKETEATYGQMLFNFIVLVWSFKKKIPFVEGKRTPHDLEAIIVKRLADDPPDGILLEKDVRERAQVEASPETAPIYVYEFLKFRNAMFYLSGFTQLCVPAATEKSMQSAPGIYEYRAKLLEENKDRLHDPVVIANIDKALVEYDRAYLKGDASENFLITKKSIDLVRKKMYGMHGAETGFSEGVDVKLIPTSLSEGWDVQAVPAYMNSLRLGSFNRSVQTAMGGEAVKWLLRASSNITVSVDDCGSKYGMPLVVSKDNLRKLVGFSVVTNNGSVRVKDEKEAETYLGKAIQVRSPMFCKLTKTDYCKVCVGERLAALPTALSSAVSATGSDFMLLYMGAAHAKALVTAEMDITTALF